MSSLARFSNRARIILGLMAVEKGDMEAAAEQYAELVSMKEVLLINFGSMTRYRMLGILATAVGKIDEAIDHFAAGYQFSKKAGYIPELAWNCCDYADALILKNDRKKAKELLEEGLGITKKLGMKPLRKRIEERLGKVKGKMKLSKK